MKLSNSIALLFVGIENLPEIGQWPKWWRGVTSLYAASIAINHFYASRLGHQHESSALDHPSHATDSIWKTWHVHCLHNAMNFAKFQHRDQLREFVKEGQKKRILRMASAAHYRQVLNTVIDEFRQIENNHGELRGTVSVRDYVTALAWQKAYAAAGAINLD